MPVAPPLDKPVSFVELLTIILDLLDSSSVMPLWRTLLVFWTPGIIVAAAARPMMVVIDEGEALCVAASRKCSNGIVTCNDHLHLPRTRLCETVGTTTW